jgi:WD40 repeat protein
LALVFADNGQAWSVEEPGVLRQLNPSTGEQRSKTLLSDTDLVWQFSPDACWLASGSDDLTLWDIASGELVFSIGQPAWVDALAFRADGELLAVGGDDGVVRLWNMRSQELLAELDEHDTSVSALAFSPDGKLIAAAAEDKSICLWESVSGRFKGRLCGHSDRVQALTWHPDGKLLVSGGWDTTARVWNTTTLETVMLLNGQGDCVNALAFSPDGRVLASADSDSVIWLWDPSQCKAMRALRGHAGELTCLAFSPDGRRLLSGGQDRRLILWDVDTGANLSPCADATSESSRVALSPDGKTLACVNGTCSLSLWEVSTGNRVLKAEIASELLAIAFSPDGCWLATGDRRGQIQLWSTTDKRLVRTFDMHRHGVTSLAFSFDGKFLASAGGTDGYVYVWSLATFEPSLLIPTATNHCTVEAVAFVPGATQLLAAGVEWLTTRSSEGVVCCWDYVERVKVASIAAAAHRLAVSPDGKQLALAALSETVSLWDLTTRTLTTELIEHSAPVTSLAYGRRGDLLATGSDDGSLRIWQAKTGELLGVLDLDSPIRDLAFSHDGRCIVTAHANATCALLDAAAVLRR